jgi:3-oxoacyl-[acyl-carrier protein] reductase/pteridine reductase
MRPQPRRRVKQSAGAGRLNGQVALVTGGALRLGRAISLALAREGCHLAVNYLRSKPAALATAGEIRALGVEAAAIRADVAQPSEVKRLLAETVRRFGRLDLLVNNAGIFFRTPLAETTPAQWDRLLGVNLRGPFLLSQAAARVMERSGGRIVNIGDVCVSKAGLLMLTRALALALAPRIQVNCVAPGAVLLPEGFPKHLRRRLRREVPMGREGDPADVASAVLFFATAPSYITGQVLFVDGGVTAR